MYSLQTKINQKLNIYTKKYHQQYTKCLIRGIEIPISQRPEELVRQILIHFLMHESGLFPHKIDIKVEVNNHDVEIYKKQTNQKFKPKQNTLMIIEVKREDVDLEKYYNQIQRYLKQSSCDIGILYNYHEIIAFTQKYNNWEIYYLNSLEDIKKLILPKLNSIDNGLSEFEKAQNGNFESFASLAKKYGKYTTHRVVFKLKHQQSAIAGYFFEIKENKIYYKKCGEYAQKESFDYQDFERLISITY
ncbi:MAG: type I restriction enzyme HsdR N-terminal domain-containing protein [Nostocaceae cyanobacterium]|nr:type I restriction enzyme HsdR N-terminal domain-containing protein [Nostocaceae cyanobacterium]